MLVIFLSQLLIFQELFRRNIITKKTADESAAFLK